MRLLILFLSMSMFCVAFSYGEEACVTNWNPSTGTYNVDPSGSVDRPRPKCNLKKHNKYIKKSIKKTKN